MDEIIETMRDRIEVLEERIRQLEDILAPSAISIPIEWLLTSAEARIFAHLTTREVATKQSIMTALYSDRPDDDIEIKIVDVFVCKLRKKLKAFGVEILTVWGSGYSLPSREIYHVRAAS